MRRVVLAYLPLALWAAAVLLLGTLRLDTPDLPSGSDKVAHFILYAVGGALAAWAGRKRRRASAAWIALGLVLLTGAADELHQATVPYRNADIMDWVADAAGALLAFLVTDRLLKKE
ncbi:MAG: VanZ family protein [Gemmatimonadota bacterium]